MCIARYLASELDLDTTGCFFLFHDIRFPPTIVVQQLVVDLLSIFELVQSTSA